MVVCGIVEGERCEFCVNNVYVAFNRCLKGFCRVAICVLIVCNVNGFGGHLVSEVLIVTLVRDWGGKGKMRRRRVCVAKG